MKENKMSVANKMRLETVFPVLCCVVYFLVVVSTLSYGCLDSARKKANASPVNASDCFLRPDSLFSQNVSLEYGEVKGLVFTVANKFQFLM